MIINKDKPVLVTGATGYVAGWIIKKLFENNIPVHAGVRDLKNNEKLKWLNQLADKYNGKITYFDTNLLKENSYLKAMEDCELVYHTASPFINKVSNPMKDLIEPALLGTRNVLSSVNQTDSVKRVVLTSSIAAIVGDTKDLLGLPDGTCNESHLNTTSSQTHQPYSFSKKIAEEEAWRINSLQNRWDLVVVNPALVLGPGINPNSTSESLRILKQIADGTMKMGAPNLSLSLVDVRDVADAHFNAGFTPKANGRHIISQGRKTLLEIADILREKYGNDYNFPTRNLPKWLIWLLAPTIGLARKMVSKNIGYPWKSNNQKSIEKLGIAYRPIEETILEHFQQMIDFNIIKRP
ncbi:MAG: NAD-dependent epimerase/dehydratase family protein [Candidatus Delongbacteria bacterium]|nr:NAD-dependent epimerase/dehydratase family protein [Candidatus Delongbacteria bacterium]MBN2833990.1 NAD-dependent epimerase/dehydratase family protein [Candidatus Delongbacteria bacterium]